MTNRRRSTPSGGSRRPQVAGLRKSAKPSPTPRPTPRPRTDASDTDEVRYEEPEVAEASAVPVDAATDTDSAEDVAGSDDGADSDTAGADTDTDTADSDTAGAAVATTAPTASRRPRPRPKARDEGIRKPESPDETVSQPSALPEGRAAATKQRLQHATWTLTSVVGALALVLALTAAFFAYKYFAIGAGDENKAMVDVVATEQLKQQVSDGLETMFSYNYNNVQQHEQAVKDVLATDEMRSQYEELMGDVKEKAPKQKVVLQTTVRNVAVIEMNENSARVLAFIDQTSVREDSGQSAATGDQPTVTAVRVDGEWKISHIDAYADPRNRAPVPGDGGNAGNGGN